jgi:N,N'-diacetyllegionaminate synthase
MAYIIAEIGNTHEGSLQLAKKFADAASYCGVDCVKFQAHYFDEESLIHAPNPPYFKDETRKTYFDRTSFNLEQWTELRRYVEDDLNLDFMCSPFSVYAIEILKNAGVKNFKVASGEVSNIPLLEKLANIPGSIFLSSGMSSYNEIDKAINVLNKSSSSDKILFQCTSEYPCKIENVGLNIIKVFLDKYPNWKIGLSDHTLSSTAAILSLSIGASVFEKHLTLSNMMYGSDAKNSLEPNDFKMYVENIREAELCLRSSVDKDKLIYNLQNMKNTFEKSIVYSKNLNSGHIISFSDLDFKKPGDGINASDYKEFIGKRIIKEVTKDEYLTKNNLQ